MVLSITQFCNLFSIAQIRNLRGLRQRHQGQQGQSQRLNIRMGIAAADDNRVQRKEGVWIDNYSTLEHIRAEWQSMVEEKLSERTFSGTGRDAIRNVGIRLVFVEILNENGIETHAKCCQNFHFMVSELDLKV